MHGLQIDCPGATFTGGQIGFMLMLRQMQPITPGELAKAMNLTPGAVSQLLEGLETAGYIQRTETTHDRRIFYLTLSPAGEAVCQHIQSKRYELMEDALHEVDNSSITVVLSVLDKLTSKLETHSKSKSTKNKT